jgi:hypothetical protein
MRRPAPSRLNVLPWMGIGLALIAAGDGQPGGGVQGCGFAFLGMALVQGFRQWRARSQ